MIKESATKLLDGIAVVRRLETGNEKTVDFKTNVLGLRQELIDFRADFEEQKTFLGQSGDELIRLLSNATGVCNNVVLLTEIDPSSNQKALVSTLIDLGGILEIDRLLKALFLNAH